MRMIELRVLGAEVELQLRRAEQVECHTMVGCCAVFADSLTVCMCWIAFVSVPVVGGIFLMEAYHMIVSVGLSQNTGSSDAHVLTVTLDDCGVGKVGIWCKTVTINDDFFRSQFESVKGAMHGQDTGTKNIDAVYFLIVNDAYSPSKCLMFNNFTQDISFTFAELL